PLGHLSGRTGKRYAGWGKNARSDCETASGETTALGLSSPACGGVGSFIGGADVVDDFARERTFLGGLDVGAGVLGIGGADDGGVDAFDAEGETQGELEPGEVEVFGVEMHLLEAVLVGLAVGFVHAGAVVSPGGVGDGALGDDGDVVLAGDG